MSSQATVENDHGFFDAVGRKLISKGTFRSAELTVKHINERRHVPSALNLNHTTGSLCKNNVSQFTVGGQQMSAGA